MGSEMCIRDSSTVVRRFLLDLADCIEHAHNIFQRKVKTADPPTYDNCMGRGVGSSNLGQTQVELSGLNPVLHELGPLEGE